MSVQGSVVRSLVSRGFIRFVSSSARACAVCMTANATAPVTHPEGLWTIELRKVGRASTLLSSSNAIHEIFMHANILMQNETFTVACTLTK